MTDSIAPLRFEGVSFVTGATGAAAGRAPQLGQTIEDSGNVYRWIYNDCNSEIYPGYGVVLQSGVAGYSCTVSAVTSDDLCVGVVQNATIPTGYYGFAMVRGFAEVEMGATSGTVAAGDLIEIGANGVFVPVSNTTGNGPALGKALDAIVSSASGTAYISVY